VCGFREPHPVDVRPFLRVPTRELGLTDRALLDTDVLIRRRGRVAEGGGLLNRYTLQRRIEGSNPSVSARL
jgi:hypothetical protein